MQRILKAATLFGAATALLLLALAYVAWSPEAPVPAQAQVAAAPPATLAEPPLSLRLARSLTSGAALVPGARSAAREPQPGGGRYTMLALGAAALAAFACAFWLGASRRSQARAPVALRPAVTHAGAHDAELEEAQRAHAEALEALAGALEARDLEIHRLEKEIADWQDAWRLAKPKLAEQQRSIERLESELASARAAVATMRRYVDELQHHRGASVEAGFAEDVDAWIARFMHPVRAPE